MVIAGLAVLAVSVKQPTTDSFTIPGEKPEQALNLLDEKFPGTGELRHRPSSQFPPDSR